MRRFGLSVCFLLMGACATAPKGDPGDTVWDFSDPDSPLKAAQGSALLYPFGEAPIEADAPDAYRMPPLPGGRKRVLRVAKYGPKDGYKVRHRALPNGAEAGRRRVSDYTFVMDVLWPDRDWSVFRALLQTDPNNDDDADFYARLKEDGGLGVNNEFSGLLRRGQWYRIAWVTRDGRIEKFVNGLFVGAQETVEPRRWSLGKEFLLFSDNDGSTGEAYVSSIRFSPRAWSIAEVEGLGGPVAAGTLQAGPAARTAPRARGKAKIIARAADPLSADGLGVGHVRILGNPIGLIESVRAARGRWRLLIDAQALPKAFREPENLWLLSAGESIPGFEMVWTSVPRDLSEVTFLELKRRGVVGFFVEAQAVNYAFVQAARKNGLFVAATGVNEPAVLEKMLEAGVEFIETDYPAQMRARMSP